MTPYSNSRCVLKSAIMVGVILVFSWAGFAQTPAPASKIPAAKDTLQYLKETIDWYRHLRLQEQMATDASDLTFLDDDRQIARQIVQLSFDFARAEAKIVANQVAPAGDTDQASQSAGHSGLAKAVAAVDQEVRDTEAEIESLKQKLQAAQGKKRRQLQSTLDEVQARWIRHAQHSAGRGWDHGCMNNRSKIYDA